LITIKHGALRRERDGRTFNGMTFIVLMSAAVLLAANRDPGPPRKDCERFVAHYRELIQHQAALDSQLHKPVRAEPPPLREAGPAEIEAGQAARNIEPDVERACREANGSQYECVVSAGGYDELASCKLHGLPVLDSGERKVAAALDTTAPPPTPAERARETAQLAPEYVRSGTIDVESLGTGSGAPEPEEEAAPESDVVRSGR
jgi:hypothetical protein